jgi:cytoskeleton protein RodZ
MMDPGDTTGSTGPGEDAEALQHPGQALAGEREDAGLTCQQIATALNLGVDTIRALEGDDYQALGAPVFVRGHLRRYAEYLKIDPVPVLEAYAEFADLTEPRVIVPERAGETVRSPVGRRFGLMVVVALMLVSAGVWVQRTYLSQDDADPAAVDVSAVPVETRTLTTPAASDTDDGGADGGLIEAEPEALPGVEGDGLASAEPVAETGTPTSTPVPTPVAAGSQDASVEGADVGEPGQGAADAGGPVISLQVAFLADAWLEVTDARDEVLFYNLGQTGSSLSLAGVAPLRVFIGDATAVTMRSDGFIIDASVFQRADRTARFALDANGMTRRR